MTGAMRALQSVNNGWQVPKLERREIGIASHGATRLGSRVLKEKGGLLCGGRGRAEEESLSSSTYSGPKIRVYLVLYTWIMVLIYLTYHKEPQEMYKCGIGLECGAKNVS